jgi:hypothetical protein
MWSRRRAKLLHRVDKKALTEVTCVPHRVQEEALVGDTNVPIPMLSERALVLNCRMKGPLSAIQSKGQDLLFNLFQRMICPVAVSPYD